MGKKDCAVNSALPVFCCTQRAQTVPGLVFLAFSIILRSICSTCSCLSCCSAACLSLRPSIGEMQGTEKQGRCQPDTLMLSAVLFSLQEQSNDLTFFPTLTSSIWFLYEASCNDGFYALHLFLIQIPFLAFPRSKNIPENSFEENTWVAWIQMTMKKSKPPT